jgi:hypothetical protein
VDHVVGVVEDYRDTRLVVEDTHAVQYSQRVWWFGPQKHPTLRMASFAVFGPQNSVVAIPKGTGGGTWRHSEVCVKAKQLRLKRVAIGSKIEELVHFAVEGLGNGNNPM